MKYIIKKIQAHERTPSYLKLSKTYHRPFQSPQILSLNLLNPPSPLHTREKV